MKPLDLTGKKFNRLTGVRRVENKPGYGQARWLFRCDCGTEKVMFGYSVVHGAVKSCGCFQKDFPGNFQHGMNGMAEHRCWSSMLGRCLNPANKAYPEYGGRGIDVCDEWRDFPAFYRDMGPRPKNTSLDRIDNNKGYSPENCRWATPAQQVRNRRTTTLVEFQGQSKSLQEWGAQFDIPYKTLWHRFKEGDRGDHLFRRVRKKQNH